MRKEALKAQPAPPMPDPGNWYTIDQIEERWGIKPTAIHAALTSGRLRKARIGQAVLIEYGDLDAWIRSERDNPTIKEKT